MFYRRLAEFILAHRNGVLIAIALLTLGCALSIPFLKFNFTPQQLFESTSDYEELRERFAERFGREDNLLMVLVEAQDVLEPEVMTYVHRQTLALRQIDSVKRVESLTTLQIPRASSDGALTTRPLLEELMSARGVDPKDARALVTQEEASALRALASREPLLEGQLVSRDHTLTPILLWLDDDVQDTPDLRRASEAVDEALARQAPPAAVTRVIQAGIPRIRVEIVETLQREQLTFIPLTGLVFLVILLILFRRPQSALLPLGTVAIAAAMTVAMLVLTGSALNIINNVLPTLIFIIGIADSIHMITRQAEEVELGKDRRSATISMVEHTGLACLLTSATTAVGFVSLLVADTDILKRFGWQAAAGVGFAYLATLFFIPAMLGLVKPVKRLDLGLRGSEHSTLDEETLKRAPRLERALVFLAHKVLARPWLAISFGALVTAVFVVLSFSVKVDTKVLEVYEPDHPTYETTRLLEQKLGGILPVEISVEHPDTDHFKQPEPYENLSKFEEFALKREGILHGQSIVDFHQAARAALLQDPAQREVMPTSREEIEQIQLLIEGPPDSRGGVRAFMTNDFRNARVLLRIEDFGAKKMIAEGAILQEKLDELFPESEGYTTYIAGDAYVASVALDSFIRDLLSSLVLAMVIIFAMMTLVFRSLKMGLISVLPNIIPLVATFGYMGLAHIDLNTSTVIIFAISLGLAVDDTIHFLTRFNEERRRREDVHEALIYTYFGAGRAILLTSILLIVGLAILLTSDFVPTNSFGRLTAITIFGALFGDLLFLPPVLLLFYREKPER